MAFIKQEIKKYNKEMFGSFGDFETNSSYELNYLMGTLDINNINDLSSASDVLKLEDVDFEQLVQRDIDYKRVDEQIVAKYLEKGENKVIFFPPLLVTPMVIKNNKPLEQFDIKNINVKKDEIIITWDDYIQLTFPIFHDAPTNYPYNIKDKDNNKISIHNYATTFEYNSSDVKLVVIDGQHRFMALKRIMDNQDKKNILENIKIPLCIFFTPNAIKENGNVETLTKSMRQLFVTINSTAKQVSGHFITLLNDDYLSSYAIRNFADKLKNEDKLFFLEWNEREDKRASSINRKYSITNVKILDSIISNIFHFGMTKNILRLNEIEDDLNKLCNDDMINIMDIENNNFPLCGLNLIKKQLTKTLTVSLELLFFTPTIYKKRIEQFDSALVNLNTQIKDNINGSLYFKSDVLEQFREISDYDPKSTKMIEQEFLSYFEIDYAEEFYFKNVFQQAYAKAWIIMYETVNNIKFIKIEEFTEYYIESISNICFNVDNQIFSSSREYSQNIFYKNTRILVNDISKNQLSNLIMTTLLNKQSIDSLRRSLNCETCMQELTTLARNSFIEYFEVFTKKNISEMNKNWRNSLDSEDELYIRLDNLDKSKDKEDKKRFDIEISEYINKKNIKAKKILCNLLEVNYETISL